MVTTHGSTQKTTHTWLNRPASHNSRFTNRFLPLADMTTSDDFITAEPAHPKKRRSTPRRKRCSRTGKRIFDRDDIDLAHRDDVRATHEVWEELPESYVPELGIMLNEEVTLNNLPRESPPLTIRVEKRRRRKEKVDMRDWDVVSTCSEESFCMV